MRVNLDVAFWLKEKGYNELCDGYYLYNIYRDSLLKWRNNEILFKFEHTYYTAPTVYSVAEWLRNTHKIHLSIEVSQVYFYFTISTIPNGNKLKSNKIYESFEEAYQEGLLYILQYLI